MLKSNFLHVKKVKNSIKKILYCLLSVLNVKLLRRLSNRDLLVINYHSIYGVDPDPVINKNTYRTKKQFEQDILYLKKHYHFVHLTDVLNYSLKGIKLPANSVFLTFDDGLKAVFEIIRPILQKHKVSGAFFLNPSFINNEDLHFQRKKNFIEQSVEPTKIKSVKQNWSKIFSEVDIESLDFHEALNRVNYKKSKVLNALADMFNVDFKQYLKENQIYLSISDIKQMIDEGFLFGGHSMDHPKYDELSIEEQIEQTLNSIKWVKEKFNLEYSIFAFPLRDHQISQKLFKAIQSNCDISFGVMGIGDDVMLNHVQRIDAESKGVRLSSVLKLEYVKFLVRKALGKQQFKRPL